MSRQQKTTEEQLAEAELEEQKLKELIEKKKKQLTAITNRKKQLSAKKTDEERKVRTHHLCQIGGTIYKILGREFEDGDIERLEEFLNHQEQKGGYFSKAMNPESSKS